MALIALPQGLHPELDLGAPVFEPVELGRGAGRGVHHDVHQLGLAGHIAIERHGGEVQPGGDPLHRQRLQPFRVGDLDRGAHDLLDAQPWLGAAARPGPVAPQQIQTDALPIGLIALCGHCRTSIHLDAPL
jgi:hypothetical protein